VVKSRHGRLRFAKLLCLASSSDSVASPGFKWYYVVILLELATAIAVFAIREDAYPFVYVRYALGLIFVFFLPGFVLTEAMFPSENSPDSSLGSMLSTERVAVSISLSIVIASLVGLVSYYAPWRISLVPVVLILMILTTVFVLVAAFRERTYLTHIAPVNVLDCISSFC
jgi:uncharacterized membrane protein